MTLNLITIENVKIELGLAVDTYDAQITAMIPRVSADVRRILNNNFDRYLSADFDTSADTIELYDVKDFYGGDTRVFDMGQVLSHPNLPEDIYIQSYDPDTDLYTLSDTPTGEGEYAYPTSNIAQWAAISKMIWYRIQKSTITAAMEVQAKSKSIGPTSITYSDNEINKQYNYPQILIDDLGVPFSEVG